MGWARAGLVVLVAVPTTVVTWMLLEWRANRHYQRTLRAVERQTELIKEAWGAWEP